MRPVGRPHPSLATPTSMARSRSDTRALVFAVGSLLIAGLVVAATILLVTRTSDGGEGPFTIGNANEVESNLEDGGPFYIANPFGGDGFYVALERGDVVALVLDSPGRDDCPIRWVGRDGTFKDCDGNPVVTNELERYEVAIPETGDQADQVVVDLDVVEPAPG